MNFCAARVPGARSFWYRGLPAGGAAPEGGASNRGALQAAAGWGTLWGSRRPGGWQELQVGVQVGQSPNLLQSGGLALVPADRQIYSSTLTGKSLLDGEGFAVCDHLAKQRLGEARYKIAGKYNQQGAS